MPLSKNLETILVLKYPRNNLPYPLTLIIDWMNFYFIPNIIWITVVVLFKSTF